ncbi:MAG: hypothetical protein APF77_02520 [Clostridia bacterium BRH_c25]|nr:MAG: hypothetical protein APF77_02520 [Clostridia bacterium BRH_c25]
MIVFKLDEKDAYKDVIKNLARNKVLYKMAEEKGLTLTMEEALEASLREKDMVQKDEKALENMNNYINALGLTEDQYWTEYHVIETQQYLSIEKLKESIANEAIEQGILPKVKTHTKETSEQYKDYLNERIKEIEDNIVIEFKDEQYKERFKERVMQFFNCIIQGDVMKKRISISGLLVILALLGYLVFGFMGNNDRNASPEQVISNYFESRNSKDITKAEQYLIKGNQNKINWNIENQEYIKIIDIEDAENSAFKKGYLENGGGKYLKPAEAKCFLVEYEVQYKNQKVEPLESGKHRAYYVLIKENANSPWKIADWGL